jgi:hypothetical protein
LLERNLSMQKKTKVSLMLLGALAVFVGFGATVFSSVKAAAATTSQPANRAVALALEGRGPGGRIGDADLAAALGITAEELTAAQQAAREVGLKQAVDEGLITQAQADELNAGGTSFPLGGRWEQWLSQKGIDQQALLADALGITVDELTAAQTKARNTAIDQAVTDGQITQEQADLMKGENALRSSTVFQSAMQSAYQAAVKAAVDAGVITQAQADLILANQANAPFGGHGMEGFGGPRGGRHGGFGGRMQGGTTPDVPVQP